MTDQPVRQEPIRAIHICSFTDFADLRIVAAGRSFRFEFSHRFGPLMLGKRGQSLDTVPPMRSPFWRALELWCKQGHRVSGGQCVYDVPAAPTQRFVRIAGRQCVDVPAGENPLAVKAAWFKKMKAEMPTEPLEVFTEPDEWACLRAALQHTEGTRP